MEHFSSKIRNKSKMSTIIRELNKISGYMVDIQKITALLYTNHKRLKKHLNITYNSNKKPENIRGKFNQIYASPLH